MLPETIGMVEATFLLGTHFASGEATVDGQPDVRRALDYYLAAANRGESHLVHAFVFPFAVLTRTLT